MIRCDTPRSSPQPCAPLVLEKGVALGPSLPGPVQMRPRIPLWDGAVPRPGIRAGAGEGARPGVSASTATASHPGVHHVSRACPARRGVMRSIALALTFLLPCSALATTVLAL